MLPPERKGGLTEILTFIHRLFQWVLFLEMKSFKTVLLRLSSQITPSKAPKAYSRRALKAYKGVYEPMLYSTFSLLKPLNPAIFVSVIAVLTAALQPPIERHSCIPMRWKSQRAKVLEAGIKARNAPLVALLISMGFIFSYQSIFLRSFPFLSAWIVCHKLKLLGGSGLSVAVSLTVIRPWVFCK